MGVAAAGLASPRSALDARLRTRLRPGRLALFAILGLSAWLELVNLAGDGWGNAYYAATVRSMLVSPSNFFFVAFDPGGFISVDKPPAGYWLQAISAILFGFSGTSLLLPQALATVASVGVLYRLVARTFGTLSGLLAALLLAVTPITVATGRNNTVDGLLVLVLLLAAWALLRATETGSWRWLLAAFALVGVGFNVKMLEAYLVLPAFVVAYLVAAPRPLRLRAVHLAAAGLVLVAVSFWWAGIVQLTPAGMRPYVGGSTTNSAFDLALDYNGIERLNGGIAFPDTGTPGPFRLLQPIVAGQAGWFIPIAVLGLLATPLKRRSAGAAGSGTGGDRGIEAPGHGTEAAGHGARAGRGFIRTDRRTGPLLLWSGWFLGAGAFFSVARFWHPYYLVVLAPAIAALAGIGLVAMWRRYRAGGPRGWLLPVAFAGTGLLAATVARGHTDGDSLALPVAITSLAVAAVLTVLALARAIGDARAVPRTGASAVPRVAANSSGAPQRGKRARSATGPRLAARTAVAVGLAGMVALPASWSAYTATTPQDGALPAGGPPAAASLGSLPGQDGAIPGGLAPDGAGRGPGGAGPGSAGPGAPGSPGFGPFGAPGFGPGGISNDLLSWLETRRGATRWALAVTTAAQAAPAIIERGLPIMAVGGFTGGDRAIDAAGFAALVTNGEVRYVLLGPVFGPTNNSDVMAWAGAHCTPVTDAPAVGLVDCAQPR